MKILVEASTISGWVAEELEGLSHEVIVADPNFAPMYCERTRRVKTDRRDAEALALACLRGNYRPAHRLSEAQRLRRTAVGAREILVVARAKSVTFIKSQLRGWGLEVRSGSTAAFLQRLAEVELSTALQRELTPLLRTLEHLNREIAEADRQLEAHAKNDPRTRRLMTVPGVGPVTATVFVATLDKVERFETAAQVSAYAGLVQREWSSSESQRRGSITKAGPRRLRSLLVEAAWSVLRYPKDETAPLRDWGERVALRRGKRRAAVAVARKLSRILYAMWRDGRDFETARLQPRRAPLVNA
jgi:transposase